MAQVAGALPVDLTETNNLIKACQQAIENLSTILSVKLDSIINAINVINVNITNNFKTFWDAYYPLRNQTPQYWKYWNSDTGKYEDTNIANVFSQATWYLGNIYLKCVDIADDVANIAKNIVGSPDSALNDKIDSVKDSLTDVDNAQKELDDNIFDTIGKFDPNTDDYFGGLKALTWCGQYLQKVFLALGAYGTPIMVGLILALCLQFIGYFRYKGGS